MFFSETMHHFGSCLHINPHRGERKRGEKMITGTTCYHFAEASFAVNIHCLFSTPNVFHPSLRLFPPLFSSSSSQGEKWPAGWLPVLFLKGYVIYPQYQMLQSAGAECSRDTSIWPRGKRRGGREEVREKVKKDGESKRWRACGETETEGKAEVLNDGHCEMFMFVTMIKL